MTTKIARSAMQSHAFRAARSPDGYYKSHPVEADNQASNFDHRRTECRNLFESVAPPKLSSFQFLKK